WDGRLRLTAREPARVFARLAELGFLDEEAARQVGAVADSMAQDGAVTAPVRLSRGAIFFMGLPVGMAPPAF
ncbi:MAG: DUF2125 domain-containing protein, partial [Caulobacterales bacterium]|nr:DUF2125 domain-containing protein [Caulobacterales bacterium]